MDEPSEGMFCSSCGEQIRRSATFCRYCGEPNRHGEEAGWGPAPDRTGERAAGEREGERGPQTDRWRADEPADRRERTPETVPADHRRPGQPGHPTGEADNPWRRQFAGTDKSTGRVVAGAVGIGLAGFLLLQLVGLFALPPVELVGVPESAAALLVTGIGQLVGFVGLGLWYLRWRGLDWGAIRSYLGVRRPELRDLGIIVGGTVAILLGSAIVGAAATALDEVFGLTDPDEAVGADQAVIEMLTDNPELIPFAMLLMFLVVGPAEELMFRGVVQARMRERISTWPAILLTSVAFASIHIPGFVIGASLFDILTGVAVLTIGSIIFGYVYERTQNIVVVALLHGFYNSVVLAFAYIAAVSDLEGMVLVPLLVPI